MYLRLLRITINGKPENVVFVLFAVEKSWKCTTLQIRLSLTTNDRCVYDYTFTFNFFTLQGRTFLGCAYILLVTTVLL